MEYYRFCKICQKVERYTDADISRNKSNATTASLASIASVANAFAGTRYDMYEMNKVATHASSQIVNLRKCTNCGSIDVELVTKDFAKYVMRNKDFTYEDLIKESEKYISKKSFGNAFCFTYMFLLEEPENERGYEIKLLSSYDVASLDELAKLGVDFSENDHFKNLMKVASDKTKEKYLKVARVNNKKKVLDSVRSTIDRMDMFSSYSVGILTDCKKELDYLDLTASEKKLYQELDDKIIEVKYNVATVYEKEDKIKWLDYAIKEYKRLGDYKDCVKRIAACKKRKEELIIQRQKTKESSIKYLKIISSIVTALILLVLLIAVVVKIIIPSVRYNGAISDYKSGEYAEAIKTFKKLGDYKKSKDYVDKSNYALAKKSLDSKDYEVALKAFEDLGDYKDSKNYIDDCKYGLAVKYYNENTFGEALELFKELGDKEESKDYIIKCYYGIANQYYDATEYEIAREFYRLAGDYNDTNQKYAEAIKKELSELNVDDTIKFGKYKDNYVEWKILEKDGNSVLLISSSYVDRKEYANQSLYVSKYYKDKYDYKSSTIREFLISTFYQEAFASSEQALMLSTTQINNVGSNTNDKIYILSEDEIKKYLPSDFKRKINEEYWLRDLNTERKAGKIIEYKGTIESYAYVYLNSEYGVRPVIRLNIK